MRRPLSCQLLARSEIRLMPRHQYKNGPISGRARFSPVQTSAERESLLLTSECPAAANDSRTVAAANSAIKI